jgi:CubicO group peptidase (beta-lactamase class C family)
MDFEVKEALARIRDRAGLPALAGATVTSTGIVASGVAGVRKIGSDVAATPHDAWHLGSCAKAMTAALIGCLIDEEALTFEDSVAEIFPEIAPSLPEPFRKVTLERLLSHRSGLPPNADWRKYAGSGTVGEKRLEVVKGVESVIFPVTADPSFVYSNWGYVILGAVAERTTGRAWEDLMREKIFRRLGMEHVGFGGTGTRGEVDQPWPHVKGVPLGINGPKIDNPPVMAPAGGIHCSIGEWAKFTASELSGLRGNPSLLSPRTFSRLHTPAFGGSYAGGWIRIEREWAGGSAYVHTGSNTMNFAVAWLAPNRDVGVLVCSNDGGNSPKPCDEAAAALLKIYADRPPQAPA